MDGSGLNPGRIGLRMVMQLVGGDLFVPGSAGVSPAVFGVPPKASRADKASRFDDGLVPPNPVGETPTGATGTVALPVQTENRGHADLVSEAAARRTDSACSISSTRFWLSG